MGKRTTGDKKHRLNRLIRDFGERLKSARVMAGYKSASDFAKDLGIEYARYTKNERGQSIPRIDVLADITKLTDTSLDFLLLGKSDRNPSRKSE